MIAETFMLLSLTLLGATQAQLDQAIPEGTTVAFELEAKIQSCNCSMMCDTEYKDPILFTQRNGKFQVINPFSEPEDIGRPVLYDGKVEGGKFVGHREDVYTVNYLGLLHVENHFRSEILQGGMKVRGELKVNVFAEPANEEGRAIHEEFSKLYSVPCNMEVAFTGTRTQPLEIDIDKRVKIWDLLKTHVDRLMMRNPHGSLEPLEEGLAMEGDHHPAFLWRKARALFLTGEHEPTDAVDKRVQIFEEGIETARKALAIDPNNGNASFFLSANLGRRNTTVGRLKTAFGLEEFETGCLKAIEEKASNNMFGFRVLGDSHFAMGQFYRLVPDSWFIELLLGTRGDIQKSIDHLRKAHALQPTRGDYIKELGVSLVCYGVEEESPTALEEGIAMLKKAAKAKVYAYPPELDYEQIKGLLADPESACSFSRDQL